jgi:mutator protein MutT
MFCDHLPAGNVGKTPPPIIDVAVAAVLRESAPDCKQLILSLRVDEAPLGGYWELPGGKIEAGESPAACVRRECAEELAIEVVVEELLGIVEHEYSHAHVRLHLLTARVVGQADLSSCQASAHWVDIDQLSTYRLPPANAQLTKLLMARFGSG